MPDERRVITQDEGDRFALDHAGGVALYGADEGPAIDHRVTAQVAHGTAPGRPLVHMVCWDEEPCDVELSGRVVLAGDADAPVAVRMVHEFANSHEQAHTVEPLDHTLHVDTALAQPIHHALQLRTPLQVQFCNPWHVASDYQMDIRVGDRGLVSLRLTGATVATPQPCDDPCPPVDRGPVHP
jgi:hypothetical protein